MTWKWHSGLSCEISSLHLLAAVQICWYQPIATRAGIHLTLCDGHTRIWLLLKNTSNIISWQHSWTFCITNTPSDYMTIKLVWRHFGPSVQAGSRVPTRGCILPAFSSTLNQHTATCANSPALHTGAWSTQQLLSKGGSERARKYRPPLYLSFLQSSADWAVTLNFGF